MIINLFILIPYYHYYIILYVINNNSFIFPPQYLQHKGIQSLIEIKYSRLKNPTGRTRISLLFGCFAWSKIFFKKTGCFLVLRKLLFVSFCVVVWVLFSVFSIFCITSLVSATPRNHQKTWDFVNKSGQGRDLVGTRSGLELGTSELWLQDHRINSSAKLLPCFERGAKFRNGP